MSSPFSTFKEFSEAKGAIYTFANSPIVSSIFLMLSLMITVYFVYASFHLNLRDESTKKRKRQSQ
jgi:hypothetical protein